MGQAARVCQAYWDPDETQRWGLPVSPEPEIVADASNTNNYKQKVRKNSVDPKVRSQKLVCIGTYA